MATNNFDRIRTVWNPYTSNMSEGHIVCYQVFDKNYPFKYAEGTGIQVVQHVIRYPFYKEILNLTVRDIVATLSRDTLRKIKFPDSPIWFLFSRGTIFYDTGKVMLQFGYMRDRKALFVNNDLITAKDKESKFIYNNIVKTCIKNGIDVWFSDMDDTIRWVINRNVIYGKDK